MRDRVCHEDKLRVDDDEDEDDDEADKGDRAMMPKDCVCDSGASRPVRAKGTKHTEHSSSKIN